MLREGDDTSSEDDDFVPSKKKELYPKHPNKSVTNQFQCSDCNVSFTRRNNLLVHQKKCQSHQSQSEASQRVDCSLCLKSFAHVKVLKRHKSNCPQNPNRDLNVFKCSGCKQVFSRKDNLSVHLKKCSLSPSSDPAKCFFCSLCGKKFSSMGNNNRHQKICAKNKNTSEANFFECSSCSKSFNRRDNLLSHRKTCSGDKNKDQPQKRTVSCLYETCDFSCWTKTILIQHLQTEHDQIIKPVQTLNFKTHSEFEAWKESEEGRTYSYFSQDCGLKGNRMYYYCQHDGSDRPHRKKGQEGRKSSRKLKIGQIKRGSVCLSKIIVVKNEDGSRTVEYYESHSHPLSKHDLAHQPLAPSTDTFINNQLAFNVPPREIYKALQSSTSSREEREMSSNPARNLIITERRIRQRAAKKRASLRLHQCDAVAVRMLADSLQHEKYNAVVVYKPMGENILVGPKENLDQQLLRDLFMFGLQTKEQRKLLVQYASKVVVVDDTHNVTQYENMKLFNMLIIDENNKGWPVGHLIANCMAANVVKIFIKGIKIRCEEAEEDLTMNCVISDDDSALINGIQDGIGETICHILCQWHLDNTFKDAIRLKSPRDMFDIIYTELKVIISEKSVEVFSRLYNSFLTCHSEDAPAFVKYLEENYSHRTKKWAMCHREGIGHGNIDTTGHAESFHNRLKTGEFKRIPNKRMDDLINTLLSMERRDFQERERLDILGYSEPPHKCREKHERGMAIPDKSIVKIRADMWQIESATTKKQSYHIVRVQQFCPKDLCFDKCINPSCHELCSHLFLCSCRDPVPLCKHVHKLQSLILKDNPVPAFENEISSLKFYSVENDELEQVCPQNEFSETNAYSRMETNLAALSNLVIQRTIPKHLLPSFDMSLSDLLKKCTLLSVSSSEISTSMPACRKIAPKEKLATQYSQMLPFKRKQKRKKKDIDRLAAKEKKEAAKENLLALYEETKTSEEMEIHEISSGEEIIGGDSSTDGNEMSPSLKDVALSVGPYRLTFLALKTLPLNLEQSEIQELKSLDGSFERGWLSSDIINAFLFSLALTNENIFAGADELALSMARGNDLKRLFPNELRDKNIFLFPANFTGNHWTIFAILSEKCKILYMDPKQNENPSPSVMKTIDTMKKIMKTVKPSVTSWTLEIMKYCYQNDTVNCGVHVCWFAQQTVMEVDYEDLNDVVSYRTFIYETLRGNCLQFLDKLNACPVCSSENSSSSSDEVTLRCSKCKQVYHFSCLDENADQQILTDEFVCPELVPL